MMDLHEIENIEKLISEYYEMTFNNDEEDYIYNKQLKNKLKAVIINSKSNNVIDKALDVLAESTGCAEDLQIAEDILNELFENKVIDKNQFDTFYKNVGTNRWS
ncbi:hypothetical protein J0383_21150 [Flavobacterium endoglycinae]|uniref:Uncharacterized protein n=1 Tax=Flavobacterium endoglycinae TaxID=2816357 RepID=A0ABX7QE03_9FLAO|nr:hypothetical protein [Flavobacterium endoglycinae]QSW88733.1 hypothetical protein J0383_21150 [Flavobacterium endoglycinae]